MMFVRAGFRWREHSGRRGMLFWRGSGIVFAPRSCASGTSGTTAQCERKPRRVRRMSPRSPRRWSRPCAAPPQMTLDSQTENKVGASLPSEVASPYAFAPPSGFGAAVVRWQKKFGRNNLPWQGESDPYKIWLAEVMLQQTQVAAVVPYYRRFVARFPNVSALASAPEGEVLSLWSGMGYYARARNLHRAAQAIRRGGFPQSAGEWGKLPGVGRSTANAVSVFASGERLPILDGNVKRVAARVSACRLPVGSPQGVDVLWAVSERLMPRRADIRAFTQGMMDLGATVCLPRAPLCGKCPVRKFCRAREFGIVEKVPVVGKKAPRKVRSVSVSVIRRGGKILMERRPSPGIWGGLLAPPLEGRRVCERRFGIRLSRPAALPRVAHDFTHFRMVMSPALMSVCGGRVRKGSGGEWVGAGEIGRAALPAPIRREAMNWLTARKRARKKGDENGTAPP